MSVDILIVTHQQDRETANSDSTINILVGLWRQMGLSFDFEYGVPRSRPAEAAVAINHVDLTITPAPYLEFLGRFPTAINGRLTDISKTRYCRGLLTSEGGHDGPVIVKTNLNHGGVKEHQLLEKGRRRWRRYRRFLSRFGIGDSIEAGFSWRRASRLEPSAYPIYDHPTLVPAGVWENSNLVVQKFLPERDERGLYLLRSWYLFGDRGFHVVTVAKEPVIKGVNIIERRVLDIDTPAELVALRKEMGMDYGRFDYVLMDGKPVIYDINRTPTSSPAAVAQYVPQWRDLAEGIAGYLSSTKAAGKRPK